MIDRVPWTVSPWLDGEIDVAPSLEESLDVDVAIIGAGYTGLSAAIAMRREGASVAVLETEYAGYGASGRNAGMLTPTIGKDPPSLVTMFGKERAKELLAFADLAILHTEGLMRAHSIECDYEPVGNVFAAVCEKQYAAVDRAAHTAMELGVPGELFDREGMRLHGLPPVFQRGFFEPHGGILNPAKYVRGLRRAALEAGARLFERTRVEGVDVGPTVRLGTVAGEVRARHLVIGTNAFPPPSVSAGMDDPVPAVARIYVQKFRTRPLDRDELASLEWPGRQGVYTAHEILEGWRLTADNRLAGGTKFIRYGYDNAELPDVDESTAARIEACFRERFPRVADVEITDRWGGPIAFALNFLPQVGRAGPHHNVLYSLGYAGHGLAQASYAGTMLSDLMHGRRGPGAALWERARPPSPPEPLRWLVATGLAKLFDAMDSATDRAIRAER